MSRKKVSEETKEMGRQFGLRIKSERERLGLSQNDLAFKTSISPDTIKSLENGRITSPGIFLSFELVEALGGDLSKWVKQVLKKRK